VRDLPSIPYSVLRSYSTIYLQPPISRKCQVSLWYALPAYLLVAQEISFTTFILSESQSERLKINFNFTHLTCHFFSFINNLLIAKPWTLDNPSTSLRFNLSYFNSTVYTHLITTGNGLTTIIPSIVPSIFPHIHTSRLLFMASTYRGQIGHFSIMAITSIQLPHLIQRRKDWAIFE